MRRLSGVRHVSKPPCTGSESGTKIRTDRLATEDIFACHILNMSFAISNIEIQAV